MSIEFMGQSGKTIGGQPVVTNQSLEDAISNKLIPGASGVNKFGLNETIGVTEETIWTGGGAYPYLAAAEKLQVSSDSTLDDGAPAGTGARTITIIGHVAGYVEDTETVIMDGTTSVETSKAYIRIFRAYVESCGSGATNAGLISIKDNADSVTQAQIVVGRGQSQMAMISVATGEEFHLKQILASESSNKKTIVRLYTRDRSVTDAAWRLRAYEMTVNLGSDYIPFPVPIVISGPADIELRGLSPIASGSVQAGFSGYCDLVT